VREVVVVGDLATDVVVLLEGSPAPGSDRPAAIRSRGGGAGANVAVHLARLGTPVTFAGCVGDDAAGTGLVAELAAAGVTPAVRTVAGAATGTIVSLVEPGGQRSMLADRGANLALEPADVPVPVPGGHLHLSGYSLFAPGPRAADWRRWPPPARPGAPSRSTRRPPVRWPRTASGDGWPTPQRRRWCCPTPTRRGCSPGAPTR
jgi:sugar/nucleoside kinase (ribokinase family)